MKIWIEVASGDKAWTNKLISDPNLRLGLRAPATKRYINFFKKIKTNDIILTHLTFALTRTNKYKSSIVGISTAMDEYKTIGNRVYITLDNNVEFPVPIKFSEYRKSENLSYNFRKAISSCLQRYLIEITKNDFLILININTQNRIFLEETVYNYTLK